MRNLLDSHIKAINRVTKYCVATTNQGLNLEPKSKRYGKDKTFKFVIEGKSDSWLVAYKDTWRSVAVYIVYLQDTPIVVKSTMNKILAIRIT